MNAAHTLRDSRTQTPAHSRLPFTIPGRQKPLTILRQHPDPTFDLTAETAEERAAAKAQKNEINNAAKKRYRAKMQRDGIVERAIELDASALRLIDQIAKAHGFKNRSALIRQIITEGLADVAINRILARTKDTRNPPRKGKMAKAE